MRKDNSSSSEPAEVFVSYRREESRGDARALSAQLNSRLFRPVFRDREAIAPGVDFKERIKQAIESCDVLIAMIGHRWVTVTDGAGERRLDDPYDVLRSELAMALGTDDPDDTQSGKRGILVIPLLVEGAPMPAAKDLPKDLEKLPLRNAIGLNEESWDHDVERLLDTIEEAFPGSVRPLAPGRRQFVGSIIRLAIALVLGILLALLVATLLPFQMRPLAVRLSPFGMGWCALFAAFVEFYGVGQLSPAIVRRRFKMVVIAAVVGLVSFVVLREMFTETVRVGSSAETMLIGVGHRAPDCPCPEKWSNRTCLERHEDETTIERCWGPLNVERVLLWAAYLTLSAGFGGLIGLIGLRRRTRAQRSPVPAPLA